ncbi:hypothetical protein ACFW9F_06620 [Streptomyces sp. NPDC059506]|uniref:hypothetical protein n=1 Tax=Streptomyces sp. NPDC059506 TaxID=3347751 RepID=UPI00367913E8
MSLRAVDGWWANWQAGGRDSLAMRSHGNPVGVHQVLGEAEQAAVRQAVLVHQRVAGEPAGQLWGDAQMGEDPHYRGAEDPRRLDHPLDPSQPLLGRDLGGEAEGVHPSRPRLGAAPLPQR